MVLGFIAVFVSLSCRYERKGLFVDVVRDSEEL